MRGIDEHDGGDVSRELTSENTNGESARRPSDEYIGRLHVRDPQRFVKLESKLLAGPRQWAGLAPTETGAVVGADACEVGYGLLNGRPDFEDTGQRRFQDGCGRACAGAIEVNFVSVDRNERAADGEVCAGSSQSGGDGESRGGKACRNLTCRIL